ncbi:MAG: HAD family hydrolase [Deltaproteobacteria bacterium]|nr:MAG: HAD family hydrolase [Deltaproteobacteria bacterium]
MKRIAMISGPRNLSTALMRSFEARGDCAVVDEPLYAAYLARTGLDHPGREAILASQPTDYDDALAALAERGASRFQYEKHMAHHLHPDDNLDWLDDCAVGLLIRHPAAVIASYARVREAPTAEDVGFPQQLAVLEHMRARGREPVVVHAARILEDPVTTLSRVCEGLGMPWTEAMLSWPPGPRDSDGVWAPHWYASVEESTGFGPPRSEHAEVPPELEDVVDACMPAWRALAPLAV